MTIEPIRFDVGIELEFFLTRKPAASKTVVYNANKVIERALGFSIDQNTSRYMIDMDTFKLRTDGTACELQWFHQGCGSLDANLSWFIGNRLPKIACISAYIPTYTAFFKQGDGVEFSEPGKVYSSGKILANAYTNTRSDGSKKEKDATVSSRTAGLHLHFSIPDSMLSARVFSDWTITNELVKMLDSLYQSMFVSRADGYTFSATSKARVDAYQKLGDYRIKYDTITKSPTLEYRQLDTEMSQDWKRVQRFVNAFQLAAAAYLGTLKPGIGKPTIHGYEAKYEKGAKTVSFGCLHIETEWLKSVARIEATKRVAPVIVVDTDKMVSIEQARMVVAYIDSVNV